MRERQTDWKVEGKQAGVDLQKGRSVLVEIIAITRLKQWHDVISPFSFIRV